MYSRLGNLQECRFSHAHGSSAKIQNVKTNHKNIWTMWPKNMRLNSTCARYTNPSLSKNEKSRSQSCNGQRMGHAQKLACLGLQESKNRRQKWFEKPRMTEELFFTALLDLCHLKHAELAKHLFSYRRRVMLRGTTSKTTTSTKQYLQSKQNASASQKAAARFLDATSREANDAVSAYMQVHVSEAPRLLRFPRT